MEENYFAPSELIINEDGGIFHLHLKPQQLADKVILVGDPGRVALVASHFDGVECEVNNREFRTITGKFKNKRITVLSTGIGCDNIDIVLNELDALVNIDFQTRYENEQLRQLSLVRIGTCGGLQPNTPVGTYIASAKSIGFDGLLNFYAGRNQASDLAFEQAFKKDISTLFVSEWDSKAQETYRANFKDNFAIQGDITKIDEKSIPDHDILLAGFPCQAFSLAGRKRGFEDTRGTLFFDVARIIKEKHPKVVFCENVKNLVNHDRGRTFQVITEVLEDLGYTVFSKILNSKDFGVPQNRERVFIIGHLRGERGRKIFPIGGENEKSSTERLGINILGNTKNPNGTAKGTRDIVHAPKGIVGTLIATDYKGPKQVAIPVQPKILVREATKQGYAEASVGDSVNLAHPNSKTRRGRVGKQIANTLLTGESQGVVEPSFRIRKLTPRECWRLQGFPDWAFDKAQEVNSNSQLYKQAGNSVTVNVIKEIARHL